MDWGRQIAFVNHFYFYLWDPDWGSAFWKTNAYAPWPFWIWLNGHTWAQRQLDKAGIGYEALDNGRRRAPKMLARTIEHGVARLRSGQGAETGHGRHASGHGRRCRDPSLSQRDVLASAFHATPAAASPTMVDLGGYVTRARSSRVVPEPFNEAVAERLLRRRPRS
jgi:hypothetical protein